VKTTKFHLGLSVLIGGSLLLALSESARALTIAAPRTTTIWQGDPETPGSWHEDSNWTGGVPNATDWATLTNGGTINIRRGAQARSLDLRNLRNFQFMPVDDLGLRSFSIGTINHLRGRSEFKSLRVSQGVFNFRRGVIDTDFVSIGIRPLPAWLFPTLPWQPFQPPFTLAGTTVLENEVTVNPVANLVVPGFGFTTPLPVTPVRRFEQSGGTLNVDARLSIYAGTFHLKRGRVRADSLLIDVRTRSTFTGLAISPQPPLPQGLLQQGGSVDVANKVLIQDGTYTLEGGRFQAETLALGDPTMESNLLGIWAPQRAPSFIQTGGLNHISGNLEMCIPIIDPIRLSPFRNVSYNLQGGRLRVDGDVIVGSMSVAPVNFLQTGGNANFGGTLRIEGDTSRYEISNGRLTTNVLEVGMNVFNAGGVFSVGELAKVTVRERFSLGAESVFQAEPRSRLRLLGGSFENFSQDEEALAGLNNLRLIFDGKSDDSLGSYLEMSSLEVAGLDFGSVDEGFEGNFALDTLRVGGRFDATLQLVDQVENQPDSNGGEALYVDQLFVAAGSTLDLQGIPLYYRNARILGNIIGGTADLIQVVPEPTSWLLVAIGIAIVGTRQRSRKKQ